jgi:hypothetical protein
LICFVDIVDAVCEVVAGAVESALPAGLQIANLTLSKMVSTLEIGEAICELLAGG